MVQAHQSFLGGIPEEVFAPCRILAAALTKHATLHTIITVMALDLRKKKILLTGGHGFLGQYVLEKLLARGVPEENIFMPTSQELDLVHLENCEKAVKGRDVIIHLAAVVGGIGANQAHPGKFFYDNAMMGLQLMESARQAGVEKFVGIGTVCEYPKITPMPFKEENLWNGPLDENTGPYAFAKKMLLVQGQVYRREYGFNAIHLLPINLYGPRDNFDPASSHVIPALIKKVVAAKESGASFIEVWGTGKASREFLYVEDAAEGIVLASERYDSPEPVNLGIGEETPVKDAVALIGKIVGFEGEMRWDATKPDGQPRRIFDTSRAEQGFGFKAKVRLEEGLRRTIEWYLAHRR